MKVASIFALLTISSATAVAQKGAQDLPPGCVELNQAVLAQAANGHLAEAEAALRVSVSGDGRDTCTGMVLANLARIMAVIGNIEDAERLAQQSVKVLESFYPPNNVVFLHPLEILASIRLGSGRISRAREILQRMQSIPIESPEDRALVHAITGALLQMEDRRSDAEAEYKNAFRASEEAGRGESTDAAVILHGLTALYLKEQRLDEARRTLDRALVIHERATDALPIDRATYLSLRGVLHARLGEWRQSEQDLRDALSLADRQPYVEAEVLRSILANYSLALRMNHHRREARSIEARKAALPTNRGAAAVVDSTQLLLERKAEKGAAH
jgi:tetratricopeptide (TPR) repeat protein